MFDPDIAPSGSLLGLLQRGRGDGPLHALAAPRAEALAALEQCVLRDPRLDWRVESRSLYYARLYSDLESPLDGIEQHLFHPDDLLVPDEHRCGLALSVLGHLAGYGRRDALHLLRRYAAGGGCWEWALDELAVRDDEAGLRALGPAVVARFPYTPEGDAELARAVREAYEPRPWQLWAEDRARPATAERVSKATEQVSFDRWQRQLRPAGPTPGWSVAAVLEWAEQGLAQYPAVERDQAAARCLAAVAGPEDHGALLDAARHGPSAARAAALRHLTDRRDPLRLDLIETAAVATDELVVRAALESVERLRDTESMTRVRAWATGPTRSAPPPPGCSPGTAAPRTPAPCSARCAGPCRPAARTPTDSARSSKVSAGCPQGGPRPCCATCTGRRPPHNCAAPPPAPSPSPTPVSLPVSPSSASGTARRAPGNWPRTGPPPATYGSSPSCADWPRIRQKRPKVQTAVRGRLSSGGTAR